MTDLYLGLITLAVLVVAGYVIYMILELRSFMRSARQFMEKTENTINPALEELQRSLASIRGLSDNLTMVTDDVKTLTGSVREVGDSIKVVSANLKRFTTVNIAESSALKAGIRAGLEYAKNQILARYKSA